MVQTLYSMNLFFCHSCIKQPLLSSEMEKYYQILWGLFSQAYSLVLPHLLHELHESWEFWCYLHKGAHFWNVLHFISSKYISISVIMKTKRFKCPAFCLCFCTTIKSDNNFKNDRKQHSKLYHPLDYNILCLCLLPKVISIQKSIYLLYLSQTEH